MAGGPPARPVVRAGSTIVDSGPVHRLLRGGTRGLAGLADLVLPRTCAGCQLPGAVLCRRCARLLTVPHLAQPRRPPPGFPPTVAAGAYTGPVRPAVNAFKEHGRTELAGPLGTALALAVAALLDGVPGRRHAHPVLLVPVPSSRAALRSRGREHVRELSGRAVAELRAAGVPALEARLLGRRGRSRDSAGLSAPERRANLAHAFALRTPGARLPVGAVVVLVDDVVSSGATFGAAAAVLRAATGRDGAALVVGPVLGAAVAATPRRLPRAPSTVRPGTFTVRS